MSRPSPELVRNLREAWMAAACHASTVLPAVRQVVHQHASIPDLEKALLQAARDTGHSL